MSDNEHQDDSKGNIIDFGEYAKIILDEVYAKRDNTQPLTAEQAKVLDSDYMPLAYYGHLPKLHEDLQWMGYLDYAPTEHPERYRYAITDRGRIALKVYKKLVNN